jgi:hypothetical protein
MSFYQWLYEWWTGFVVMPGRAVYLLEPPFAQRVPASIHEQSDVCDVDGCSFVDHSVRKPWRLPRYSAGRGALFLAVDSCCCSTSCTLLFKICGKRRD